MGCKRCTSSFDIPCSKFDIPLMPCPSPALRRLGEGGSFSERVEGAGIQLCRVGLAPPIVIPAKPVLSKVEGAGIQIPSFTNEERISFSV